MESDDNKCRELLRRTRAFWEKEAVSGERGALPRLIRYIGELLPLELECTPRPDLTRLPRGRCDILVLLVGQSFEPLLHAVLAYQPTEVLPVLNKFYREIERDVALATTGKEMRHRLDVSLNEMQRAGLLSPVVHLRDCAPLEEETPSAVFRFLLQHLRRDWADKTIVIDITGAKKSMVAGAFFLAAYCNTPVSYVDFDIYDPLWRRPYGCTCRVDFLANPYRDFYLRDWSRVRRLYEQYAFAAARQEVEQICEQMELSKMFSEQDVGAARQLEAALAVYEAWDNGDYHGAAERARSLAALPGWQTPWAVEVLGTIWPYADQGVGPGEAAIQILARHLALKRGWLSPEDSLFNRPEALLAYVLDELAKVERLTKYKEDYRGAFLRAAGLEEFLLKARLALCFLHNWLTDDQSPILRLRVDRPDDRRKWFGALVTTSDRAFMRNALLRRGTLRLRDPALRGRGGENEKLWLSLAPAAPEMEDYGSQNELGKDLDEDRPDDPLRPALVRMRGEAIHTHLYLNKAVAAEAAKLAAAAVDEFQRNWLAHFDRALPSRMAERLRARAPKSPADVDWLAEWRTLRRKLTDAPSWDTLCHCCGVDFLPPYLEDS